MITKERIEAVRSARKGFTLIEILIVVAIIAILASVVLVGLGPTQQAGRDARRVSDLKEVQNGLELYYNKNGHYPGTAAGGTGNAGVWGPASVNTSLTYVLENSGVGVTAVPQDPSNARSYNYGTDNGVNTKYILAAMMENASGTVFTNYSAPSTAGITFGGPQSGYTAATNCTSAGNYCVTL